MLFPTASFVLFFLLVFVGGWLLFCGRTSWRAFMLAASYVFYSFFDWRMAALMAAASVLAWVLLRAIAAARGAARRALTGASVALHLALLVYFKFLGFFVSSFVGALALVGVHAPWAVMQAALPVGISFFVFRAIGAAVDVHRREAEAPGLLDYALFAMFFAYVSAGPIVRLGEVVAQFRARHDPRRVRSAEAFGLIAAGLVKKMLVADYLARTVVDSVFATPALHTPLETLAGIYGYAVQIYCDFSGYTDMAIGIALLLGVSLPVNFDAPYAAASLQHFWRRWHVTLSNWLRDYLYIPLGGSRRGTGRTYVNLVVTMLLGGLWHGAGWTFVIWGAIHGAWLALERAVRGERAKPLLPAPAGWFVTFNVVCAAWVFFRAETLPGALAVFARLGSKWSWSTELPAAVWVLIAAGVVVQFVPKDWRVSLRRSFALLRPAWQGVALALVMFVVSVLGPEGPAGFIYSGF